MKFPENTKKRRAKGTCFTILGYELPYTQNINSTILCKYMFVKQREKVICLYITARIFEITPTFTCSSEVE